jgi:hypothetical protein
MSHVVVRIFTALFATHYPDLGTAHAELTRPFNLHLHWGARDMAGFPPRQKGYFASYSKRRSYRIICDTLLAHFPAIDPLCIALLPAAIFMLCPASAHPRDATLLAELFRQVREAGAHLDTRPDGPLQQAVEDVTRRWLARHAEALSPYFANRFHPRRGVLHTDEPPAASEPHEPDGFRALTLRQACMIVGALVEFLPAHLAPVPASLPAPADPSAGLVAR